LSLFTSPIFMKGFLRGSFHKLFPWAGFKPQSSWSLPPKQLGLQARTTTAQLEFIFYNSLKNIGNKCFKVGEMTQTMCAHVNKWIRKKFRKKTQCK
jgi:hypothetical protein